MGLMEASYGDQVTAIITYNLNSAWLSTDTLELPSIINKEQTFFNNFCFTNAVLITRITDFFTQSNHQIVGDTSGHVIS